MTAAIALPNPPAMSTETTPKVAGLAYVGAWVVGLTAFGAGPSATASDSEIARFFAGHRAISTVQSLFIHGIAAIALLVVITTVERQGTSNRLASAAGLTAVSLSLVQCGLDIYRSMISTGTTTATLVHTIDRIDGAKMLALAVMIGASVKLFRSTGMIGRKMELVGKAAVPALVVSGLAYATATTALLAAAEVSLVLLLTWVGYTGVAASRSTSRRIAA